MKKNETSQFIRALVRYYSCEGIKLLEKIAISTLVLGYIISPVDLIPDVPIIGWLDDIGVGALFAAYCSWRVQKADQAKQIQENSCAPEDEVLVAEVVSSYTAVDQKSHQEEQLFSTTSKEQIVK